MESKLVPSAAALLGGGLALLGVTGCMSTLYGPGTPTNTPTTTASASPSADPTANWVLVRNQTGVMSLRYPPAWQGRNCEGDQSFSPHIFLGTGDQPPCNAQDTAFQIYVIEFPSNDPGREPAVCVGTVRSTTSMIADGVQGTRVTAEVTDSAPLPPPKGTIQTIYTFTTNGRTYKLFYDREPGAVDLTADFDLMVKSTLAFSG